MFDLTSIEGSIESGLTKTVSSASDDLEARASGFGSDIAASLGGQISNLIKGPTPSSDVAKAAPAGPTMNTPASAAASTKTYLMVAGAAVVGLVLALAWRR
jgi:hypothetical protein